MNESLVRLMEELASDVATRAEAILLTRMEESCRHVGRPSEYLSVAEAAELLRCKPQRVYDLVSSRRLTRYRDGSRVLVSRTELEAHLAGVAPALPHTSRSRMNRRAQS